MVQVCNQLIILTNIIYLFILQCIIIFQLINKIYILWFLLVLQLSTILCLEII